MALWFVAHQTIVASPSDAHDGRDLLGLALEGASKSGDAVTSTGAFAGYSHVEGDLIALTDGVDWGWYVIASRDSDDQITLGELLEGTDLPDGSVDSSDGPFATFAHAIQPANNTAIADGDAVILADDGEHLVDDTVTIATEDLRILGCVRGDTDPIRRIYRLDPDKRVVLRPSTAFESGSFIAFSDNDHFEAIANLHATGIDENGEQNPASGFWETGSGTFYNCRVERFGNHGVHSAHEIRSVFSSWLNNGSDGFGGWSRSVHLYHSLCAGNGGYGARGATSIGHVHATASLFLFNGEHGLVAGGSSGLRYLEGCSFVGNGGSGLVLEGGNVGTSSDLATRLWNNSFAFNAGYGIEADSEADLLAFSPCWNHFHGNGAGALSHGEPGPTDVTGDPKLLSPVQFTGGDWDPATRTLSRAGAFAHVEAGDTLRIAEGGGAVPGIYTVASKVDDGAVVLDRILSASGITGQVEALPDVTPRRGSALIGAGLDAGRHLIG